MMEFTRLMKLICTCNTCCDMERFEGFGYTHCKELARARGWILGRDGEYCCKDCWRKARNRES